jgi:hypothetical protein
VTSLTGTMHNAGIYSQYEDFIKNDRLNSFKVEDFYFLKKNVPPLPLPEDRPPKNDKKLSKALYA